MSGARYCRGTLLLCLASLSNASDQTMALARLKHTHGFVQTFDGGCIVAIMEQTLS
ncbi:unnamed protein product [Arctogadus glacialis]